jgi:hypothetical protein
MTTHLLYKSCACGQRFASEGELARHQRTCSTYRQAVARTEVVEPLWTELRRIDAEVNGIYVLLAHAFREQTLGVLVEAKYHGEVATERYQHLLLALSDLGQAVAAAAKNKDALVNRVQSNLKDLIWRFDDLKSILHAIRPVLSIRNGG